jgi:hypothetical protein
MTQYMQLVGPDKKEPNSTPSTAAKTTFDLETSKKVMKDIWSKTTDALTFTDKKPEKK